jgi:hypothetical protein
MKKWKKNNQRPFLQHVFNKFILSRQQNCQASQLADDSAKNLSAVV